MVKLSKMQHHGLRARDEASSEEGASLASNSDDLLFKDLALLVLGPRKAGKSHLAATASDLFPETLRKKTVSLDDMIWLSYDTGATDFMIGHKLKCPHVYAMHQLAAKFGIIDATRRVLQECVDLQAKGQATWVVADTVSMFDTMLIDKYAGTTNAKGEEDSRTMYRYIMSAHIHFQKNLSLTGLRNIYLCHSKALGGVEGGTEEQKAKTRAEKKAKFSVLPEIIPAITGQGAQAYQANVSAQCVLLLKQGPKGEKERRLYLELAQGFEAGSRWEPVFKDNKEGIEPHLGKMLAQVRNF